MLFSCSTIIRLFCGQLWRLGTSLPLLESTSKILFFDLPGMIFQLVDIFFSFLFSPNYFHRSAEKGPNYAQNLTNKWYYINLN